MRRSLFIGLLLFISCALQAQDNKAIIFDWFVAADSMAVSPVDPCDTLNRGSGGSGEILSTLAFTDDTDRGGGICESVIRDGTEFVGTFTPPTGFTISSWEIIRTTHSKTVAARGTGNTVTKTFNFVSMDSCNVYDLWCEFSDGSNTYEWISPGEFLVLPQIPDTYDATWTTSQQILGEWTDRKGAAYKITGDISTRFGLWDFQSSDPADPVHIVAENATITADNAFNTFECGPWKNIILDGCTGDGSDYGLTLVKPSGATQGQFFINTNSTSATNKTKNAWVVGVHAINPDGVGSASQSIAGFRYNTVKNATVNESNYAVEGLILAETKVTNAGVEGYYIGQSNDAVESGRRYPTFRGMLVFNNVADTTGNDGFQMQQQFYADRNGNGYFDDTDDPAMFFKNRAYNAGTHEQSDHYNLFQFTPAHVGSVAFMNYGEGSHNAVYLNNGTHGMDFEFFSNVIYSTGRDPSVGVNMFISLSNGDSTEAISSFKNNTVVVSSGDIFTLFHGATTTDYNKLYVKSNAFVNDTGEDWELGGSGWDTDNEIEFDNLTVTDISTLGFVDVETKDYRPSSSTGSLWADFGTEPPMHSKYKDFDFDGYKFTQSIAGAFSGVPTLIEENATAPVSSNDIVSSVLELSPITVDYGTAWPPAELPSQVSAVLLCSSDTMDIDVTWSEGGYSSTDPDTYAISGTLDVPEGIYNPDNLSASIEVTVGDPLTIESVAEPSPISVEYGTAWPPAELPSQVTATLSNASTDDIDVTWAQGAYNADVADTYTISGTLTNLPSNITNPSNVTVSMDVTVEEEQASGPVDVIFTSLTNATADGNTITSTGTNGVGYGSQIIPSGATGGITWDWNSGSTTTGSNHVITGFILNDGSTVSNFASFKYGVDLRGEFQWIDFYEANIKTYNAGGNSVAGRSYKLERSGSDNKVRFYVSTDGFVSNSTLLFTSTSTLSGQVKIAVYMSQSGKSVHNVKAFSDSGFD